MFQIQSSFTLSIHPKRSNLLKMLNCVWPVVAAGQLI